MRTNTFVLREARCSPTCCSATRSTARRPRPSRRCSRRCRSTRSRSRRDPHARRAVHRARDPEPDRAGGQLPAARAQVDRFLIKLKMGYPAPADEKRMLGTYDRPPPPVRPVVGPADVLEMQALAQEVFVAEELLDYVLGLVAFTRSHPKVYLGASPRAGWRSSMGRRASRCCAAATTCCPTTCAPRAARARAPHPDDARGRARGGGRHRRDRRVDRQGGLQDAKGGR